MYQKWTEPNLVDVKFFYHFCSLHLFCRTRFNDSKPFWERGPKLGALTVQNIVSLDWWKKLAWKLKSITTIIRNTKSKIHSSWRLDCSRLQVIVKTFFFDWVQHDILIVSTSFWHENQYEVVFWFDRYSYRQLGLLCTPQKFARSSKF
jgi:hypothetical protein